MRSNPFVVVVVAVEIAFFQVGQFVSYYVDETKLWFVSKLNFWLCPATGRVFWLGLFEQQPLGAVFSKATPQEDQMRDAKQQTD